MNGIKKFSIRIAIILYAVSYFLQNSFFVQRNKTYAAQNPDSTKLVAIFVDKDIYPQIKNKLERYSVQYIQQKIGNSKAIVLPIDTATIQAHEISQILENMYFEGIKDQSSQLIGTILIGNVPLPVVENNGFVYPSIFPYVDFEDQQFIYDSNKKSFIDNNNPNGQAELRHGVIQFQEPEDYNEFFEKIQSYNQDPTSFIDKAIWYDDMIGLKQYYLPENNKYYINNMLFGEDIAYHRFTNTLVQLLTNQHNQDTRDIGTQLSESLQDTDDPELEAYAQDIQDRSEEAENMQTQTTDLPTMTLQKTTKELLKTYEGTISTKLLAQIKDNIASIARRYKTGNNDQMFTDFSSTTEKILQKDNRILGDLNTNMQPLLVQINDYLQSGTNQIIEEEKYYMTVPLPVSRLNFKSELKGIVVPEELKKCIRTTYDYHENFLFGKKAEYLTNLQDTSIYRGTFQNLSSISGTTVDNPLQSIGGSYHIFSTQVEANRGYDFNSTVEEFDKYQKYKTNKESLRSTDCRGIMMFGYCIGRYVRKLNDSDDEDKCYIDDEEKQGGCESMTGFAARNRGGASPLNIDSNTQTLTNYNYKNAVLPIYNIAGSKALTNGEVAANSYQGIYAYTNMIRRIFSIGVQKKYTDNSIQNILTNAKDISNGNEAKFASQYANLTYSDVDFFARFGQTQNKQRINNKAVLYNLINSSENTCETQGIIYTYKTIDSRIQNTAPEWDQISNSDFFKFKEGSDLYRFYINITQDLARTKSQAITTTQTFSGASATDNTGVITNLSYIKNIIASGNQGMQDIINFDHTQLPTMTTTQVANKATLRNSKNFNLTKINDINNRISKINQGLESLQNYVRGVNIYTTQTLLADIIQNEGLKGQNVEILTTRKSTINQNFDAITGQIHILNNRFITAKNLYNSVGQIQNSIFALQTKKNAIAALQGGQGCSTTYYKLLCDSIDSVISIIQTQATQTNTKITNIAQYTGDNDQNNTPVIVRPFIDIAALFSGMDLYTQINQSKTILQTFTTSTDTEKKETNKGMNLTTQDRPIDNIRNITFQGIGGDLVKFVYPNLYEIQTYTGTDKLILKTIPQIKEAIKQYLTDKAKEYNTLLQTQTAKKTQYYQQYSQQFDFLGQSDALANPNNHTYDLIPQDYFIQKTIEFLDILEEGYGQQAIYGNLPAETDDQKLEILAKLLYYQNSPRPEKTNYTTVQESIQEAHTVFDINQKISETTQTYLTHDNDQGKFITPTYNKTGYEIGYINSDGHDYIEGGTIPAFIKQIQDAQTQAQIKQQNSYITTKPSTLQEQINACEGVDVNGAALLFDFKTFKSPRLKAMQCRAQQILSKPFDIQISFKNAQGPVVAGVLSDLQNTYSERTQQRETYGSQRSSTNNETIIQNAPASQQDKLKSYENNNIIVTNKTSITVNTNESIELKLGMTKDVGLTKIKISATGDVCFSAKKGGSNFSNICTKAASEVYNPHTEQHTFVLTPLQNKAGTSSIKIQFCLPQAEDSCIQEQKIINILPDNLNTINIQPATQKVMEGGQIPILIQAQDKFGNPIGQDIQSYKIYVGTGQGSINDGNTSGSISFSSFTNKTFIYQAPTNIANNKTITVIVEEEQKSNPSRRQQNIEIVKGIITIDKTNIDYTLPKNQEAISYIDDNNLTQINPENLPGFTINVKDTQGNPLDTVMYISSQKGLLTPGVLTTTEKDIQGETKQQLQFSSRNNLIINNGQQAITLYPNFKAGNDIITIQIPGKAPIIIPVTVRPGPASTVLLNIQKTRLDTQTTTQTTGTIQVVDARNNNITQDTNIKLGILGAGTTTTNEFTYTGQTYTFTIQSKPKGGQGHVFAYIKNQELSQQMPGYQSFIVQDEILPTENLNIMYLNAFGTDRGNQRGYFSENDKKINSITKQSKKLLATTTQLIDPNKIKQIAYIVSAHGQIQNIEEQAYTIAIQNENIVVQLPNQANIILDKAENFKIQTLQSGDTITPSDQNTIFYIPEITDSIITNNTANKTKIRINDSTIIDLEQASMSTECEIKSTTERIGGLNIYHLYMQGTLVGKLALRTEEIGETTIQDPVLYGQTKAFSEGSTNNPGIGIYLQSSTFTKQGYDSIEDSSDVLGGIGFTNKFKNITNFANGEYVGEATIAYGSPFLINFGDPILERRDKNTQIPNTDFDASIGQTIYADPDKTIYKTLPTDFNNDGTKDLIVVYNDGTIKLIKNYGGSHAYQNLEELMIISEPIQDIHIGDTDGNGFEDIILISNNKGFVYTNDEGVFSVDGKMICLNTIAEPGQINPQPENFGNISQIFIQDMNKDEIMDIVSNDIAGDIRIFYGGETNNRGNYISTAQGICDNNRYQRQKNNYQIIKRFGIKINSNRYIQDASLVHRKNMTPPGENTEDIISNNTTDTLDVSQEDMEAFKDETLNNIMNISNNTNQYIAAGMEQLAYTNNPLSTAPVYETTSADNIYYLPINQTNDTVSIYKQYEDINGGRLKNNDEVVIKTTIIAKKTTKLTYIDQLKGPRKISKDDENKIPSMVFLTNTGGITINRNAPQGYQFVLDNIVLQSGSSTSFSYTVTYQSQKPTIQISIKDEDLASQQKTKDSYPDIIINSTDSCQKNRRIFFNKVTGNKKSYEEIYDNVQSEIENYNQAAQSTQDEMINNMIQQLQDIENTEDITALPAMSDLESRTPKNLISQLLSPGGISQNIHINAIDEITNQVSETLDTALNGLCQGFTLGDGGCQGIPVPFNQAFLAPGKYHIFGCVPTAPNPLAPVFETLNRTIGKGIPVLTFPGNRLSPVGAYLPFPGIFGLPFKGPGDTFYLGTPGGTYPSQFRLYIVPTLTLGLGVAMCFGPMSVGKAIPKPFSDMGGNCVVFALPPMTNCSNSSQTTGPQTQSIDANIVNAANVGVCNNPPKTSNTITFATNTTTQYTTTTTANSPFQLVAASSTENNPPYSAAIPQGNFGGLIQIDQEPLSISAEEDYGNAQQQLNEAGEYELTQGPKITNKILGGKTQGLVKCVVQDWMTRQIQYIQNNLTKMTVHVDLPDLTTTFQGFDKIGNLQETYQSLQAQDKAEGYIQTGEKIGNGTGGQRTSYLSAQQAKNISKSIGENPFEAIQEIFKEVPLIQIESKDINIQIPNLTSDEINAYGNYLKLRGEQNQKILEQRETMFKTMTTLCKSEEIQNNMSNNGAIKKQIAEREKIQSKLTPEQKQQRETLKKTQAKIQKCITFQGQASKYITFKENSAGLIRSVKQNNIVLEKYKSFPTQLYERTHLTDRYMTEIGGLVGDFVGGLTYRMENNANRYEQYVDAMILMAGTVKTWQALIDFSVNRSEKCSTCSNDNYGSYSCSLSFLCPKLPIFPIPSFKIPNIYMDMSHVELGMNIVLPKINFVPKKTPLPQIPNIPEPPATEIDRDVLANLDINFFEEMSLPTIPVIPEPPVLPEPPSFIPSIKMELPVLPPAPKIPEILPEISAILNVGEFIGKVFCIVKGGIGLVGENGVKAKVEQLTQRTREVPVFDFIDLTAEFYDPPLQGFDYKLDAYTTLKFNFDGVYDVFNNIANTTNDIISKVIEQPVKKAIDRSQEQIDQAGITSGYERLTDTGFDSVNDLNQNISPDINLNGYIPDEEPEMISYVSGYTQLTEGLIAFKQKTTTNKEITDKINAILGLVQHQSKIQPATDQIQNIEKAAQQAIQEASKHNKETQEKIQNNYDEFIKNLSKQNIQLVSNEEEKIALSSSLLTIDPTTKNILDTQNDPTKEYFKINKTLVEGYLGAIETHEAKELNMSQETYDQSKTYLQTTKNTIDTALLAYNNPEDMMLLAQTCTDCENTTEATNNNYSTDISAYVQGIFVETYSGEDKKMTNTVSSKTHITNVDKKYITDQDLNNDTLNDILMYDDTSIYIKYADQEDEHLSQIQHSLTQHYNKFYSYATEHTRNRYIQSRKQLEENTDKYGYLDIKDISIKVIQPNKEVKNFVTKGQSFDNLQVGWKNSKNMGEFVDGYLIQINKKIDKKDDQRSRRELFVSNKHPSYILALPENTDHQKALLTIDEDMIKTPVAAELGERILDVVYYNPTQDSIQITMQDMPRERLYVNIATLTIDQQSLTNSQQKSFTLYKKTSPRSNQTVVGVQNIGDVSAPQGKIQLQRNATNQIISEGNIHEGFINTNYTLKSTRTDQVAVTRIEVRKDGELLTGKNNDTQTGTIDIPGLFFTGTTQQQYEFLVTDHNNNIAREKVTIDIKLPDIEITELKKTGTKTAQLIAKISNDIDEGMIIFQRLRNGLRKNLEGTEQNQTGGFSLRPNQTIITGGIFTIGKEIALYDNQNNEIAYIDPESGNMRIAQGYEEEFNIQVRFVTHIPVVEIRNANNNQKIFEIVLPITAINDLTLIGSQSNYIKAHLLGQQFGDFNDGYCIKNTNNECILYTNTEGAIYVPGIHANTLTANYLFDTQKQQPVFIIKDENQQEIAKIFFTIKK